MDQGERVQRERRLRNAVQSGDERAWREWYEETFADLDAYVAWRCGGLRDLADEVMQDTWLIGVRRLDDFDPVQGSFLHWLCGIAANVLRGRLRQRARHLRCVRSFNGEPNSIPSSTRDTEREDQSERIAQALDALPERYEQVLRAKYLDLRSVADIASSWQETPKSIESLLTRARQAFREAYNRLD